MIEKTITIKAIKNWQNHPTKPGIYLIRTSNIKEKFVIVYKSTFGLSVIGDDGFTDTMGDPKYTNCKWFGPIKL